MHYFQSQFLLGALMLFLLSCDPNQPTTPLSVELVQSYPVETTLRHPELALAQDVWMDLARNAKSTIDLEQMYLDSKESEPLEPIIQELEAAARRGVHIRLILSKQMSGNDPKTLERLKALPNFEFHVADFSHGGGIQHSKFWLVDHQTIYVGSQNLDWKSLKHIHELGVKLTDPMMASGLLRIFERDWNPTREAPEANRNALLSLDGSAEMVASPEPMNPAGMRASLNALVELIGSARRSIRIQLLDYAVSDSRGRWTPIDSAIRLAAARGVSVELVVSHWNAEHEKILEDLRSLARVPNVQVRIVTVPEAKEGKIMYARVVHSKYMVVDDSVLWVGTANWSKSYFISSRNVDLVIRNPKLAKTANEIFALVRGSAYAEVVNDQTQARPRY